MGDPVSAVFLGVTIALSHTAIAAAVWVLFIAIFAPHDDADREDSQP